MIFVSLHLLTNTLWRVHLACFCIFMALHLMVILDFVNQLGDDNGLGSALHGSASEVTEMPGHVMVTIGHSMVTIGHWTYWLWTAYFVYGTAHVLEEAQQFLQLLPPKWDAFRLLHIGDMLYTYLWVRPNLVDVLISFLFIVIAALVYIQLYHFGHLVNNQQNSSNITSTSSTTDFEKIVSAAHLNEWLLMVVCFMTFPLTVRLSQRFCIFKRFGLLYVATWETLREDVSQVH